MIADGKFQPSGISGEVTPWLYSDGRHSHGRHDHCRVSFKLGHGPHGRDNGRLALNNFRPPASHGPSQQLA